MFIDLTKIPLNGLEIDKEVIFDKSYYQNTAIKNLKDVNIEGLIKYDYIGNIDIDLKVKGVMTLLDAIDLHPNDYPFNFIIQENLELDEIKKQNYFEKTQNSLDIMELLWQNIVLEVPIRVISDENKDVKLKGDGWQLNEKHEDEIDPRLAPLLELLDEGKE